ncbi:Fc.00g036190.m01.CDS01 [Cosmosporella sp. VM-42]
MSALDTSSPSHGHARATEEEPVQLMCGTIRLLVPLVDSLILLPRTLACTMGMHGQGLVIATNLGPWLTPTPGRSLLKTRQFGTGLPPDQYSSAIRMVTARGDLRQDVCSLLYRMSLTDDTPPSLAVRHSMNAISYLHLQRPPEALYHHTRAVSALQHAIGQIPDPRAKSQAIAASMLLSLFEALDKSGTIGNWSIYFDGCLMIINSNCQKHQTFEGDEATLLDWVFYHSVMYKFSVTHWLQRTRQQEAIIKREMVVSNPIFSPQRHIIHSTLGCSLELLDLLGQIFDLVRNRQATEFPSKEYECTIACLDRRLRAIDQRLCSGIDNEEFHVVGSRKHYTLTARLFQLSGLIYLDRVARGSPITSTFSRAAAEEAFGILKDTGICERPFPLFILSIQSESDKNRLLMLDVLERTRKERPLSNLAVTEQLMCKAWAQKDLHGGEDMDALFLLNTIFSANDSPPSLV